MRSRSEGLRLAMIGCGGRAHVHAPVAAAREDVHITRWLDVDTGKAAALATEFGGDVAASWEEVLSDPEIDGVVVALPHDLHFEYGMSALGSGKHVMMEIPIAATPEQSRALIGKARASGLVLLVLHSLRFWESHRQVADLIADGTVGRPLFIRYHNEHTVPDDYFALEAGHFAAEAGVLHHGDIIRWWGGEVTAVTARGLSVGPTARTHKTFDHITVLYEIGDSALGETTCSWITRSCSQNRFVRAAITCTDGSIALTYADDIRVFRAVRDVPSVPQFEVVEPRGATRPEGEISHFADCIAVGATPIVSPEDALKALELALAARTSAREGRRIPL